jgi:hypothetical protein
MKRKLQDNCCVYLGTRSKKPTLSTPYTPICRKYFWVSGTDVRNYMLKDPLVDWLKFTRNKQHANNNRFFDFITQQGRNFEDRIVKYVHENKIPVVTVSEKITNKTCRDVINLMHSGIPIIHSAPFKNAHKHIRGVIDLLVRSDFLHIFTGENPLPENLRNFPANKLNKPYHYVVIDVKFSTLPLRADGIHLLNTASYPAYKSQLWIYTQGIGEIQGYTSQYAYILGRRYRYTSKGETYSSLNCLDKLGTIDYKGVDIEYIERTTDAINWLRELRKNGRTWITNPPSRMELYPNMCVDSGVWNHEKQEIAQQIGDITQIWYCGTKNREKAIQQGIFSWRDSRCSSSTIGMNGSRASTVDKIIDINRQNTDKILPKKISTQLYNWRDEQNEMFVDFETFTDMFASFDDLPYQGKTDTIFMIGAWYKEKGFWCYKNFVANKATLEEEYRIMDEFAQFVQDQNNPKLWYWHADQNLWQRAENRQMDNANNDEKIDYIANNFRLDNWADLCQVFRDEPIVIKDCFKFGLKEISKAMQKHGMITTNMESSCHSGIDAAVTAWQVYQTSDNPVQDYRLQDIAKYNKFDVKVLWEILGYLRRCM